MVVVTTCTTLQLKREYFYVSRPLKFIELTREDKDVLSRYQSRNSSSKIEFLNLSRSTIAASIEK
jgi:hypothetical protein